jgi:EmrB/QacA subfamily drug resistance transporter
MNSPRARWLGLVGLTMGVSLIIVDATILNVAVPAIVADLGLTLSGAQWANTIYALVLASLLVTAGRLADRVGRRRAFAAGIVVFLAGSVVAGLATAPSMLLVARFIQGLGGAVILPTTLSLVNASFRGSERTVAFAVYGSVIGGVVALGPLLGGWAITSLSWRWAFFVNIPLGVLALVLVARGVVESQDPDAPRGFDVFGTVTFALGIASLVFVTIDGRAFGWTSPTILGAAGAAVLLLAAFAWGERRNLRRGRPMLLEFPLFRIRSFAMGNVTAAVVSLGEFGVIFFLPLWFQVVRGYSALETGVALLALASGAFVAAGLVPALTPRIGRRNVVLLGMALELVGILVIALTIAPDMATWTIEGALLVYGIGVGFATAQLTSLLLSEVPVAQSGAASGMSSTSRQLGSALGIAIVGTVFAVGVQSGVEQRLDDAGVPARASAQVAESVAASGGERPLGADGLDDGVVRDAVAQGISDAARTAGLVAAGFVLLGLLAGTRLPQLDRQPDT